MTLEVKKDIEVIYNSFNKCRSDNFLLISSNVSYFYLFEKEKSCSFQIYKLIPKTLMKLFSKAIPFSS